MSARTTIDVVRLLNYREASYKSWLGFAMFLPQ